MSWKKVAGFGAALASLPWYVALAVPQPPIGGVPDTGVPKDVKGFYDFFCIGSNWFFAFVIVIAVIALLYAAIKFFTAGGNEDSIAQARRYVVIAIIGIAVAMLARSLVYVVGNFVGATGGGFFAC